MCCVGAENPSRAVYKYRVILKSEHQLKRLSTCYGVPIGSCPGHVHGLSSRLALAIQVL